MTMALPTRAPKAAPLERPPPPAGPPFSRVGPTQVVAAGALLARAFHEDPLFQWSHPDAAQRARALPVPFQTLVRFGQSQGEVLTTPGLQGVAIWIAPGTYPPTEADMERTGMTAWPEHLGPQGMERIGLVMGRMDTLHERNVPRDHWYLWVLGVDTPHQGQGIGSRLMAPLLQRADAEARKCYLETFQPRNLPLYRRHGFEVVDEVTDIGEDAPPMWTMRREPGARGPGR